MWRAQFAVVGALVLVAASAWAAPPERAGIIVGGKDEETIAQIMRGFTKALGVKCPYCHVRKGGKFQYQRWTKKTKRIALWMYAEFTQKLKKADGGEVTCGTCHQGKARFLKHRALR